MWFSSEQELQQAVQDLEDLGPACRRILCEAVREQEITRRSLSPSAEALSNAGFLWVVEPHFVEGEWIIRPTLWGEEALEAWQSARDAR